MASQITNDDLTLSVLKPELGVPVTYRPIKPVLPKPAPAPLTLATITPITNPKTSAGTTAKSAPKGTPVQLWNLAVTTEPYKVNNTMYILVTVEFSSVSSTAQADIWLTGYHGNLIPVLAASGQGSPISFLADATGETVTVTAVAVNSIGVTADFNAAPASAIVLNGVASAPPAPVVSASLSAFSGGYQFTFDYLSGILTTIITGYNVYRNTSANTFAGSTKIRTVLQDSTGTGSCVFQDAINQGSLTYYYFVTSVDVYGNESLPTSAQSGAVQSVVIGFSGAWSSTVAYTAGAEVSLSGTIYLCISGNTNQTPPNPTYWTPINNASYVGVWSGSTTYSIGQTVSVSGALYIAIAASTNQNPTTTTGYWQLLTATVNFIGAYNGSQVYTAGSMVTQNGAFWVAITAVPAGNTPAPGSSYWLNTGTSAIALAAYSGSIAYSIGMETVGTDGNVYSCIASTKGNAPPNGTYWQLVGPNSLTSVPGSSTFLNASLNLFAGPTWCNSNNFSPTTTNIGGVTNSTSYVTLGTFPMYFNGNFATYGGYLTLSNATAGTWLKTVPYAGMSGGSGWTGNGSTYWQDTLGAAGVSTNLLLTNFNFNIPAGATVTGFSVDLHGYASVSSRMSVQQVQLYAAGYIGTAKVVSGSSPTWTTADIFQDGYGGSADMWGASPSVAQINASTFGFGVEIVNGLGTNTVYVDTGCTMTVYTNAGAYTAKGRIRIGTNYGTEASLSGAGPTAGTSFITSPATGLQTIIVEAYNPNGGGPVTAEFAQINAIPQSGSMFT